MTTDRSGEISVTVQVRRSCKMFYGIVANSEIIYFKGDLTQQEKRAVFMTVHDLGCNHNSFQEFVNSPCMTEIKERSCFIHIDVSGHADNAESLPDT